MEAQSQPIHRDFSLRHILVSLFFIFTFSFIFYHSATGQSTIQDSEVDIFKEYRVSPVPELVPLATAPADARFQFFWIFGNGEYQLVDRDSFVQHPYPSGWLVGSPDDVVVRVYLTDLYSGGQEPPDDPDNEGGELETAPTPVPGPPPDFEIAPVFIKDTFSVTPVPNEVDTFDRQNQVLEGYLDIEPSTHGLRPGDTMVFVMSFRNTGTTFLDQGLIHFFYNSRVDTIPKIIEKGQSQPVPFSPTSDYGQFDLRESIIHFGGLSPIINKSVSETAVFKRVQSYSYSELDTSVERRVFMEFALDSVMWDYFDGEQKARVKFLAVMTEFDPDGQGGSLDDEDQKLLGEYNLFEALANDTLNPQGVYQPIDALEFSAELVKSHDPNSLSIEACKCPGDSVDRKKLLFEVKFSNDGYNFTRHAYVEMKIPEELELDSSTLTIVSYPEVLDAIPEAFLKDSIVNDQRLLYLILRNIGLQPTTTFGIGHPDTEASIAFTLTTRPDVQLEDIPEMQACIFFESLNTESVCTQKASVRAVISPESDNAEILDCIECPPVVGGIGGFYCGFYCWLIIILVLLILILLIAIYVYYPKTETDDEEQEELEEQEEEEEKEEKEEGEDSEDEN